MSTYVSYYYTLQACKCCRSSVTILPCAEMNEASNLLKIRILKKFSNLQEPPYSTVCVLGLRLIQYVPRFYDMARKGTLHISTCYNLVKRSL
jgi:hypothetical protein